MPFKALNSYNQIVQADECGVSDKGKAFRCITQDCRAIMSLVHAGDPENAFFRRRPSSAPHISVDCVRCGMVFNQHKYVENLFSKETIFSYILSTPGKSKHSGTTGTKRISTAPRSAAKTLRTMYEILCEKGITSDYNGIPLGSIFATYENYNDYRDKLIGKYIVEASFYYKPYNESFLIFNYPYDYKEEHIYLKVNMPDNNKAMDYYNRFRNKAHTDVIVLCGDWRESNHEFYTKVFNKDKNETEQIERHISFECDYISGRQIYDPS